MSAVVAGQSVSARQLVVIESSSPTIKNGQILDSAKPLSLGKDVKLTLIADDGQVTKLAGPFSGLPVAKSSSAGGASASGGTRMIAMLSRLVGPKSMDQSSIGTVRSGVGSPPRNPWAIDVKRRGAHCVKAKSAKFWRTKSRKRAKFSVLPMPGGPKVKVKWPKRTELLKWPGSVPLTDGAAYKIKISGMPTKTINIHLAPSNLPTPAHGAAWMVGKGCMVQAKSLLKKLK
ncbi:MAG: hypothetical protein HOB79_10945 [Rhodospirillaceae bacterium]|nr:hypothetical protein [Rhodospirillaceae bacterium]MBT7771107.1 hypothetical protein [Rhodospirillales bacterium]MBT4701576.1 hypothetical protein [Rhodospirillaceae bacterium]MBT5036465.1 hypothetical protein [Rhodospirillaceae bacterium]MBT6218426.1 hypothetical protein [Rhodospirillaceae bacterium]